MKTKFRYDPKTDSVVQVGAPPKTNGVIPPKHVEALAYDPVEVPMAKEIDKRLGLGDVTYDEIGCPVFTSTKDYDNYVKAHGFINRSSCGNKLRLTADDLDRAAERVGGSAGSWQS